MLMIVLVIFPMVHACALVHHVIKYLRNTIVPCNFFFLSDLSFPLPYCDR